MADPNASARFIYEYPAIGIVQEWTSDKSLSIFVISNSKTETIDNWAFCVKQVLSQWKANNPCFLLHDLRKAGIFTFNSQLQFKFEELYQFRPNLRRFVAVVLSTDSETHRFAQLSVRVRELMSPPGYPAHWDVFTSRHDALNWLLLLRSTQAKVDDDRSTQLGEH